jgi:hypothetical protein
LFQSSLTPIGWWANFDKRTASADVEIPQSMQRAVGRQLIRSQATDSSPRFLILPREEIATNKKLHISRSAASWRLGTVGQEQRMPAKQHPKEHFSPAPQNRSRIATAFSPIASIPDYFWHFTAFLP